MRDEPAFSFKQDGEKTVEPLRDVVRVQDRDLRCFSKSFAAHHPDVHPRDGEDTRAAVSSGGDGTHSISDFGFRISDLGKSGKKGHKMLRDTDRTNSGSSAAVGNAECLVKIEMANIGAHVAGTTEADLGVHVRAVHVNL